MRVKAIKYGVFAVLVLTCACSPETDNVFGASPAERHQQAAAQYAAILEGATDGWAMDFYPGEGEYGGIAYTARFADGKATLACEQTIDNTAVDGRATGVYQAGQEVTSDYRILNGRGVMLSFDTYNPLLHYWSQPSGTDYDGMAGDYEFTFVSASVDSVVLRGVKHGNLLRMYPLGQHSGDYLQAVSAMRALLAPVTRKRLAVDGLPVDIPLTLMENQLSVTTDSTARTVPYVYTHQGLRLYAPIAIGGATLFELQLDAATGSLRSADGRMELPRPTTLERFCGTTTQWHFILGRTDDAYQMCDELRTIFKEAISLLSRQRFETLRDVFIGMNKLPRTDDAQRIVMGWTSAYSAWAYEVTHGIDMTVADEASSLVSIVATDGGNLYYNYAPYLSPMLAFVTEGSPWRLAFDDNEAPTRVRLTSQGDSTKWFDLKQETSQ